MKTNSWFEIDKAGLAKILQRKGKEFIIFELIQNAWDEEGVTRVDVTLEPITGSPGYAMLRVTDDAPDGFSDLTHAYTLFAESKKKSNPEKRGRFNLGEKLVLALASEACVSTTTGTVNFTKHGRTRSSGLKRDKGSMISMMIRVRKDEIDEIVKACNRLVPPAGLMTTVNGNVLSASELVTSFRTGLATEIADGEGHLTKTTRVCDVSVYNAKPERPAAIYEMGIPVCEIDGKYIFDVSQKVPLTMDREEVLPSFRKQLAVAAVNNLATIIDSEDANTTWAADALTSPDVAPIAVQACMTQRFGEKRVIYDPSDPEANSRAAAAGFTVVTGSQLPKAAWANVKAVGAILPAGQVTPSPKPYSPDGAPLKLVKEVTPGMREVEEYAKKFAFIALGVHIHVTFAAEVTWPYAATYGPSGDLTFNAGKLGKAWFNRDRNQQEIDDLLIHEFGHQYSGNHLSEEYYSALTKIGAQLAQAIRAGKL